MPLEAIYSRRRPDGREPNTQLARRTNMRRLAAMAMIALATLGCIGSSGSSAPSSSTGASTSQVVGILPPGTNLLITYTVPTCPPGARCPLLAAGQDDFHRVSRRLTCSPAGGDYDDPAGACRALTDVVAKLDAPGRALCWCPLMLRPANKAVGIYRGKRRTIQLDGCSLCGLRDIGADIALLMPGAQV
jgi:hypothetical protein